MSIEDLNMKNKDLSQIHDIVRNFIPTLDSIISAEDKSAYKDILIAVKKNAEDLVSRRISTEMFQQNMDMLTRALRAHTTGDLLDAVRVSRQNVLNGLEIAMNIVRTMLGR